MMAIKAIFHVLVKASALKPDPQKSSIDPLSPNALFQRGVEAEAIREFGQQERETGVEVKRGQYTGCLYRTIKADYLKKLLNIVAIKCKLSN